MNTITPTMLSQLSERLLEADADRDVRAIVVTGAGRAWCAGLDIAAASSGEGIGGDGAVGATGEFELRSAPPVVLNKIDTPTIAALNGGAAGYGMTWPPAVTCGSRRRGPAVGRLHRPRHCARERRDLAAARIVGMSKAAELLYTAAP